MGWPTKYTGPQIDEALEKGRNLRITKNGWIRLTSSASAPTDLGTLKTPGNFLTMFWSDGPTTISEGTVAPMNIVITPINGDLYQFAEVADMRYMRVMRSDETAYGAWVIDQVSGSMNTSPTAPESAIEGKTIWLDTSNAENPSLKIYTSNGWVDILPYGAMQKNIYDTQGKNTDIFQYIDDAIAAASIGSVEIDFQEHIEDTTIHVTAEEKDRWNNSASIDDVTAAMDALKPEIDSQVNDVINENLGSIGALSDTIATVQTNLDNHISDTSMHPTAEKQAEWDSKADKNHTHNNDGTVFVDAEHIVGTIPIDKIPFDAKERVYIVKSEEEMLALEKNPVHNGDVICVELSTGNKWYFVVDDEKLGEKTDGITWIESTISSTSRNWRSVCYGNDKFVAIAESTNYFAYSTDGINWTESTISETSRYWISVCYGNDKFVAVAYNDNYFAYSTDGITWTESTIGELTTEWHSVCYGNGKFVAVTTSNYFAYSTDGITWTERTISELTTEWYSVCYGNDKFVAVAYASNYFAYSSDGTYWTKGTISSTTQQMRSVCYGNDKFVAVGHYDTFAYSSDGISWTVGTISDTDRTWQSVCYGNDKFVAVAGASIFAYSTDGITWTKGTISSTSRTWYSVCYGKDKFVAITYNNNYFAYLDAVPPAMKAFKQFSEVGEIPDVSWSSIQGTPTTLEGYGITDAASLSDIELIKSDIDSALSAFPSDTDLSQVANVQTTYNSILDSLNTIDSTLDSLDTAITSLEAIVS